MGIRYAIELIVYWLLLIVLTFCIINIDSINQDKQRRYIRYILLLVIIGAAYRTLGLDLRNYRKLYETTFYGFWMKGFPLGRLFSSNYEAFHYILARICGRNGFRLFMAVETAIPLLAVIYVSKDCQNPLLYFAVYLLINISSIDVTRQFLANAFIILSLPVANSMLAALMCSLSGLAHYGVVLLSAVCLLKSRDISEVGYLFIVVIGIIVLRIGFPTLSSLLDSNYYSIRVNSYNAATHESYSLLKLITIYLSPIILIALILRLRSFESYEKCDTLLFSKRYACMAVGLYLIILFGLSNETIAQRSFNFISQGLFFLVSAYLEQNQRAEDKIEIVIYLLARRVLGTIYYLYVFMG